MNVGKMAILDALDAATGEYLFSVDAGTQNVITQHRPEDRRQDDRPEQVARPEAAGRHLSRRLRGEGLAADVVQPADRAALSAADRVVQPLRSGRIQVAHVRRRAQPAEHPDSADGTMGRLQAMDVDGEEAGVGASSAGAAVDLAAGHGRRRGLLGRSRSGAEGVRRRIRKAAVAGEARRPAEFEHHHLQRRRRRSTSRWSSACATITSTTCRGPTTRSARRSDTRSSRPAAARRSGSSRCKSVLDQGVVRNRDRKSACL